MNEGLLLVDEQTKWFLEIQSTPDADAVKTAEMTPRDLEYYTKLEYYTDKAVAGFERVDSHSERSSMVGKMLPNSLQQPPP